MVRREAFELLGLRPEDDVARVRARYRELVKSLHPDGPQPDAERFRAVTEAYRLIDGLAPRPSRSRQRRTSRTATAERSAGRERESHSGEQSPQTDSPAGGAAARVISLGRVAVKGATPALRTSAIRMLATTGLRSAAVYVRQALFDNDESVARAAARAFVIVPRARRERQIIDLFEDLTSDQRIEILNAIHELEYPLAGVTAYALGDPNPAVRRRAQEVSEQ